tara:strand:- start:6809 stop:6937 length:129 start_codon:yes stop_codon:yes gene_type:complete
MLAVAENRNHLKEIILKLEGTIRVHVGVVLNLKNVADHSTLK